MREDYLNRIEDPSLKEMISPIYNYFERFLTDSLVKNNEQIIKDENETSSMLDSNSIETNGEEKSEIDNREKENSKKEENKDFTKFFNKSRYEIEKNFSKEYIENRVNELKDNEVVINVNKLLSFSLSNEYKILHSLTSSLSTNVTQFLTNQNNNMRTATKWRKVVNSYISLTQAATNIDVIENVRAGSLNNREVIISLGLVDYYDTQLRASVEIDKLIELSKNNSKFIVVPVFGCTTNIFFKLLHEFQQTKILHVAGHGGIFNNKDYVIQFSDGNMKFPTFLRNIEANHIDLDMMFLNCCYSYEFVQMQSSDLIKEMITHSGEVDDTIAIDFSDHYFTTFFYNSDAYVVSHQGGSYSINKNIYDESWSMASSNSAENPFCFYRL